MREIRFRAWDRKNRKWFKPIYKYHKGVVRELLLNGLGRLVLREYTDGKLDFRSVNHLYKLSFATGLKDRNGKEIYEGDIIHSGLLYRVVVFDNYKWMLVWKDYSYNKGLYEVYRTAHFSGNDFVVVGNVFEHPGLVKKYDLEWVAKEYFNIKFYGQRWSTQNP